MLFPRVAILLDHAVSSCKACLSANRIPPWSRARSNRCPPLSRFDSHCPFDLGINPRLKGSAMDSQHNSEETTKLTTRQTLTDAQKLKVCLYMKEEEERTSVRPTNKQVAAWIQSELNIKVVDSTVSRLKRQAPARLSKDISNPTAKRHRPVLFPELERMLGEYVESCRGKIVLTDALLTNKGKECALELKIPYEQLSLSGGWLHKFKARHGLRPGVFRTTGGGDAGRATGTPEAIDVTTDTTPLPLPPPPTTTSALDTTSPAARHSTPRLDMDNNTGFDSGEMEESSSDMNTDIRPQHTNAAGPSTSLSHNAGPRYPIMKMEAFSKAYGNSAPLSREYQHVFRPQQQQQPHPQDLLPAPQHQPQHQHIQPHPQELLPPQHQPQHQHMQPHPHPHSHPQPHSQSQTLSPHSLPPQAQSSSSHMAQRNDFSGEESLTGSSLQLTPPPPPPLHPARMTNGTRRTRPPSSSAVNLTLQLSDPIAAGFEPEPIVEFVEAAQCINTLRCFMQQQHYTAEQMEHLRDIYMTLNEKKKKQQGGSRTNGP